MSEEPQEGGQAENTPILESEGGGVERIARKTADQVRSLEAQSEDVNLDVKFEILGNTTDDTLSDEQRRYLESKLLCRVTLHVLKTGESMIFIIPGNDLALGDQSDGLDGSFPLGGTGVPMGTWTQLGHRPGNTYYGTVTWELPMNDAKRVECPPELKKYFDGVITADGKNETGYYNPFKELGG